MPHRTQKPKISRDDPPSEWVDAVDESSYDVARVTLAWRRGSGTYRDYYSSAVTPSTVETKRGPRQMLDLENPRETYSAPELAAHLWELAWTRFDEVYVESDGRAKEVWIRLRVVDAEGNELAENGKRVRPPESYAPGGSVAAVDVSDEVAGPDKHERGLVRQQALALGQRDALIFKLFDRVEAMSKANMDMSEMVVQMGDRLMQERDLMFREEVQRWESVRDEEAAGALQGRALDLLEKLGLQWMASKVGRSNVPGAGGETVTQDDGGRGARGLAAALLETLTDDQREKLLELDPEALGDFLGTLEYAGEAKSDDELAARWDVAWAAVEGLGPKLVALTTILTPEQIERIKVLRETLAS
jgi:hypothetical protein